MLMVFMAFINFTRMKVYAATRWLWLALSGGLFVTAPIGCEEEDPQPLYGAPEDVFVLDSTEQDIGPQPEYGPGYDVTVPDAEPQDFQTLYGPPPDFIQGDDGATDQGIQPLYGAVEIIDDYVPPQELPADDLAQPMYGALEVFDDADDRDGSGSDVQSDLPQTLYGPAAK